MGINVSSPGCSLEAAWFVAPPDAVNETGVQGFCQTGYFQTSKVRWPLEKGRGWGILFGSIINLGADPDCLGILFGSIINLVGPRIVFRLPSHPFPVSGPCHHPLTHAHCSSTPYPRDCCPWCSFLTFLELLPVGDLVSSVNSAPPTPTAPPQRVQGEKLVADLPLLC